MRELKFGYSKGAERELGSLSAKGRALSPRLLGPALILTALAFTLTTAGLAQASTVTQDFTSSTTWTVPAGVTSIDILAVGGGGGGGGGRAGGGGGGGQVAVCTGIPVTGGQTLTVTVGAGGTAGAGVDANFGSNGDPGSASSADYQGASVCEAGFGAGGQAATSTEGGLGGATGLFAYPGGAGKALSAAPRKLRGGGGAGAAQAGFDGNAPSPNEGAGGEGSSPSSFASGLFSDVTTKYGAGGGGGGGGVTASGGATGGTGGVGGGGAGWGTSGPGASGAANSGGGGGGGSNYSTLGGGDGGSGLVAVRYPATTAPLTVSKSGSGSGTVSSSPAGIDCGSTCSAEFDGGTEVTLTATAAQGSEFAGWGGACAGTATCKVTVNEAKSVTATFNTGGPAPGPTPSNDFTVRTPLLVGTGIRTLVKVPGAGVIRQAGTFRSGGKVRQACGSGARTVSAAGTYRFRCRLSDAVRAARRKGAVRVRLLTTFTPSGGTARVVARTVVLRSLKPRFTG